MGQELTVPVTGLDCVIPTTLETNVKYLHEFLFGDKDYQPSEDVMKRSEFVKDRTGFGEKYIAEERKYLISDSQDTSETGSGNEDEDWNSDDTDSYDGYEDEYDDNGVDVSELE